MVDRRIRSQCIDEDTHPIAMRRRPTRYAQNESFYTLNTPQYSRMMYPPLPLDIDETYISRNIHTDVADSLDSRGEYLQPSRRRFNYRGLNNSIHKTAAKRNEELTDLNVNLSELRRLASPPLSSRKSANPILLPLHLVDSHIRAASRHLQSPTRTPLMRRRRRRSNTSQTI